MISTKKRAMKALDKDYEAHFGHIEKDAWYEVMNEFQDANLYQTWSYDVEKYGRNRVDHMILRKSNTNLAAVQVRIYRLPVLNIGIVYALWGPMWKKKGETKNLEVFRQAIRALRNEFSFRRGLVVRLYPLAYQNEDEDLEGILNDEGYRIYDAKEKKRTLVINLDPSLQELRALLDRKWRNHLNKAEKNDLELIFGEKENLFDEFKKIYEEMAKRKELNEISDIEHLKKVQRGLPPHQKLKVILCRMNDDLCAGAICSAIGNMGVYLKGATSNVGMKTNGSYIVQWAFLKWLKENGFAFYDLNGINPNTNPGTYTFKCGLAGKGGRDVHLLGKFQVSDNPLSSLVIRGGEWAMESYLRAKTLRKKKF